jgi:hypothetical protein
MIKTLLIIAVFITSASPTHAQQAYWHIESHKLDHPAASHSVDVGGTKYWHNENKNNHLSYEKIAKDTVKIVVVDYDMPDHPEEITQVLLYRDTKISYRWWAQKITITAYGKQPDGKISPTRDATYMSDKDFAALVQKIFDRFDRK